MGNMKANLELDAAVLALIDQRRGETGDPDLGEKLVRAIMDEDLRELGQNDAVPELVLLRKRATR